MTCLGKLAAVMAALLLAVVALFFTGIPQGIAAKALVSSLERRQGLKARLGRLSISGFGKISMHGLAVLDNDGKEPVIEFNRVDTVFDLRRIDRGLKAVDEILIEGGCIHVEKARHVARQRRRNRPSVRGEETGEIPAGAGETLPSQPVRRRLVFRGLILDGGVAKIGIGFLKARLKMRIDDVGGVLAIEGSKVRIERLGGVFKGVRLPEVHGLTVKLDALSDPDGLKMIPRRLRGALLAIGLLLGGRG